MKTISGATIPLDMNHVDTDLIIPAQYLTSTSKEGYGKYLFQRLRESSSNFVFNQEQFKSSTILITKENFGCGSSREHAVWALKQAGLKAIIAVSFADIFFNNAAKNGLLLITLSKSIIEDLIQDAPQNVEIDLINETISTKKNTETFSIDTFHKYCFIEGINEMDYLLSKLDIIKKYKSKQII